MNMLKTFNEEEQVLKAKQKIYEDVQFPDGFAKFLEALKTEQIIKEDSHRQSITEGYRWIDEVRKDGIQLNTTLYPYALNKQAGDVTIIGSTDNIELVHSIMERHRVKFKGSTTPEDIELNIQYHKELNPKLWQEQDEEFILLDEVQSGLEDLSQAFFEFLDLPTLKIEDVTITGSSANYNWTDTSDLDIHLVVDMKKAEKEFGKLAVQYFDTIKKIWNDLHSFNVKGIPVEFYVQSTTETHNSTGIYSLKEEKWVVKPKREEPDFDDNAVKSKVSEWMSAIREIASSNKAEAIEKLMDKLSKLRQAGLDKGGEFSTENLAFKTLRNEGYLDLLAQCKVKSYDRELSIEEEQWSHLN